jgi:hypothetical protein
MRPLPLLLALWSVPAAAWSAEIHLSPSQFRPANSAVVYAIDQGGLGCLRLHQGTGFLVATVPARAGVVEEATALVEDHHADALALLTLARRRPTSFEVLAMSAPSRGGGAVESLTVRPADGVTLAEDETLLVQVLITGSDVCLHGAVVKLRDGAETAE